MRGTSVMREVVGFLKRTNKPVNSSHFTPSILKILIQTMIMYTPH